MPNELNDLQKEMLKMMKWFHEFCNANNIKYYMVGGTMLGAARHNGFIPWDDDIDVGVPREDFNRLVSVSKKLKKGKDQYIIETHKDGNEDFQYACAKVYDTHTTLIENKKIPLKRGIFIDVFPLDGIGNIKKEAYINYKKIKWLMNILTIKTCEVRKGRSWKKNLVIKIVNLVPNRIINVEKVLCKLDSLCSRYSFNSTAIVGNLVGMWREREIMPKKAFGNPKLYSFEDTEFYGVQNYDMYLTYLYKDWRKLPPKEKQKSDHDFIKLDLHTSFIEED